MLSNQFPDNGHSLSAEIAYDSLHHTSHALSEVVDQGASGVTAGEAEVGMA